MLHRVSEHLVYGLTNSISVFTKFIAQFSYWENEMYVWRILNALEVEVNSPLEMAITVVDA